MAQSREEVEALKRIEEILAQQQDAQAPEAERATVPAGEDAPVDPGAIQEAEALAASEGNQNETTNAILEQVLAELQGVSNILREMMN